MKRLFAVLLILVMCIFALAACGGEGGTTTADTSSTSSTDTTSSNTSSSDVGGHEHSWEAATCVLPATCKECGDTEGETDPDNHASDEFEYTLNGDGTTYTKSYKCCGKVVDTNVTDPNGGTNESVAAKYEASLDAVKNATKPLKIEYGWVENFYDNEKRVNHRGYVVTDGDRFIVSTESDEGDIETMTVVGNTLYVYIKTASGTETKVRTTLTDAEKAAMKAECIDALLALVFDLNAELMKDIPVADTFWVEPDVTYYSEYFSLLGIKGGEIDHTDYVVRFDNYGKIHQLENEFVLTADGVETHYIYSFTYYYNGVSSVAAPTDADSYIDGDGPVGPPVYDENNAARFESAYQAMTGKMYYSYFVDALIMTDTGDDMYTSQKLYYMSRLDLDTAQVTEREYSDRGSYEFVTTLIDRVVYEYTHSEGDNDTYTIKEKLTAADDVTYQQSLEYMMEYLGFLVNTVMAVPSGEALENATYTANDDGSGYMRITLSFEDIVGVLMSMLDINETEALAFEFKSAEQHFNINANGEFDDHYLSITGTLPGSGEIKIEIKSDLHYNEQSIEIKAPADAAEYEELGDDNNGSGEGGGTDPVDPPVGPVDPPVGPGTEAEENYRRFTEAYEALLKNYPYSYNIGGSMSMTQDGSTVYNSMSVIMTRMDTDLIKTFLHTEANGQRREISSTIVDRVFYNRVDYMSSSGTSSTEKNKTTFDTEAEYQAFQAEIEAELVDMLVSVFACPTTTSFEQATYTQYDGGFGIMHIPLVPADVVTILTGMIGMPQSMAETLTVIDAYEDVHFNADGRITAYVLCISATMQDGSPFGMEFKGDMSYDIFENIVAPDDADSYVENGGGDVVGPPAAEGEIVSSEIAAVYAEALSRYLALGYTNIGISTVMDQDGVYRNQKVYVKQSGDAFYTMMHIEGMGMPATYYAGKDGVIYISDAMQGLSLRAYPTADEYAAFAAQHVGSYMILPLSIGESVLMSYDKADDGSSIIKVMLKGADLEHFAKSFSAAPEIKMEMGDVILLARIDANGLYEINLDYSLTLSNVYDGMVITSVIGYSMTYSFSHEEPIVELFEGAEQLPEGTLPGGDATTPDQGGDGDVETPVDPDPGQGGGNNGDGSDVAGPVSADMIAVAVERFLKDTSHRYYLSGYSNLNNIDGTEADYFDMTHIMNGSDVTFSLQRKSNHGYSVHEMIALSGVIYVSGRVDDNDAGESYPYDQTFEGITADEYEARYAEYAAKFNELLHQYVIAPGAEALAKGEYFDSSAIFILSREEIADILRRLGSFTEEQLANIAECDGGISMSFDSMGRIVGYEIYAYGSFANSDCIGFDIRAEVRDISY